MESKIIKKVLKEKGIDTKKVSVRCEPCGYSERVSITLKDINININEVESIVKDFEYIDRDEKSYEILEGGNTYVFVQYDYNIIKEANEKYNPLVIDIINRELLNKTEEEQKNWYDGECNPVLTLSKNIICYRDGKSIMIRDFNNQSNTRRSGETYLAETLIQMGLLKEVLNNA